MNIKWDYSYYQAWSDNEWLVDEMLALLDEDITMFYYVNISDVSGLSRQLREDSETEHYLSLFCTLWC